MYFWTRMRSSGFDITIPVTSDKLIRSGSEPLSIVHLVLVSSLILVLVLISLIKVEI